MSVHAQYAILTVLILAVIVTVSLWPRKLVWVRAPSTGKEYRVKPLPDAVAAADRLAELEQLLRRFLREAEILAPHDVRLRSIRERWNGTLAETPGGKDIAYSIGKDSVYVCVRDSEGRLDDVNTCMFVLMHELAHVGTDSWGHTDEFWQNMQFLLELAEKVGVYSYQDFEATQVTYCGRLLGGSPLKCVKQGTCRSALR
jgi:hypothetical protein